MNHSFNKEYYESGIENGISGYQNYRWIPELTIPLAHNIIKHLSLNKNDKILDFGCAKGYLVYALELLGIDAYGYDISEYAIANSKQEIRHKLSNEILYHNYNYIISKDVFEHLTLEQINKSLETCKHMTDNLFIIVPLAKNNKFIIPSYELDITHVSRYSRDEWYKIFNDIGWGITKFDYLLDGIKDNYKNHKNGNGFFILHRIKN